MDSFAEANDVSTLYNEFVKECFTEPYRLKQRQNRANTARQTRNLYDENSSSEEEEEEFRMTARSLTNLESRDIFRYFTFHYIINLQEFYQEIFKDTIIEVIPFVG
jgi:hypothetical protein